MMQMFKYPQGEGGRSGRIDASQQPLTGPSYPFIYALPLAKQVCHANVVPANCYPQGGMVDGN